MELTEITNRGDTRRGDDSPTVSRRVATCYTGLRDPLRVFASPRPIFSVFSSPLEASPLRICQQTNHRLLPMLGGEIAG